MTLAGRCPSSSSLVSATSSPSPLPPTQTPKQPYLGWRSQVQFLRQNDVISLQIMLTPMLLMMTKVLMLPLTGAPRHRSVLSELSGTPARGNHGAAIAEVPQVALSTLAVRTRIIRPDISHFFSTNVLLGSIFLHMKARKSSSRIINSEDKSNLHSNRSTENKTSTFISI